MLILSSLKAKLRKHSQAACGGRRACARGRVWPACMCAAADVTMPVCVLRRLAYQFVRACCGWRACVRAAAGMLRAVGPARRKRAVTLKA